MLIFGIVIIPIAAFILEFLYFVEFIRPQDVVRLPQLNFLLFAALLVILLFSVTMSLLIVRSITRSVAMLEKAARRIANGELDLAVDVKNSNEITSLSNSLNKMRNAFKEEERRRFFFIMGITHDLKTPLSLIRVNAEAVEDGTITDAEEQKRSMNIIMDKVDELEGMINNLLDFVRLGSDKSGHKPEITNLRNFLSSYVERVALNGSLLRRKVVSDIDIPDKLAVEMDSHLIQRALDNITSNSFRYTPEGSCLSIAAQLAGNAVKLTFSDNGEGIKEKDLPYIFDPFYRGSPSREDQGLGFGLTVTKSIVESHGWKLGVSSSPGRGASFVITIPV